MSNKNEKIAKSQNELKKNLKFKGLTIPVAFAVIVVILCMIFANPHVGLFPSGNHHDSLTTTKPTQTTEFNENEFNKNA